MIASIVNLIRAFVQWIWRMVTQPWIRWTILGVIFFTTLVIAIATGVSFTTVYSGIIIFLFTFGVLSLWIKPLRGLVIFILVLWGLIYFGQNIIVDRIIPKVNSVLSSNFSNYEEWKETRKKLANNKLAESIISMKKEMLQSEIAKGTFGKLIENSVIYDDFGNPLAPFIILSKDQRVMSLGLESKKQISNSEGLAYVLIANQHGDFVKSRSGLIPIRKIKWGGETSTTEPQVKGKVVEGTHTVNLTFDKWDPKNLAWQKVVLPESFRGKLFWVMAEGIHYQPFSSRDKKLRYLKVNPSKGANPWNSYPAENRLPIKDKTKLCKLITQTTKGEVQFAGNLNDIPIRTDKEHIFVSLNMVQKNKKNWDTAHGEIKLVFIPVEATI